MEKSIAHKTLTVNGYECTETQSYWCDGYNHRVLYPHVQCPNRIVKALSLYPRCVLCNLRGSEIEGLRRRMGWSKRETAKRLEIPWTTYRAVTDFRRSGKRSEIHTRLETLIEDILSRPNLHIKPEILKELTASPMDFFNKYIGSFPWQEDEKHPSPEWPETAKKGVGTNSPMNFYPSRTRSWLWRLQERVEMAKRRCF